MATNKTSAALLRKELAATMELLTLAQAGDVERASTAVTVAALMSKSWTLRYQIASAEHDAARDPKKRDALATMMLRSSKEAENWAKRLGAARKGIDVDDEDDAEDHEREQDALAGTLLTLAKG